MLYGFCGDYDVCRRASSVMTTSAATKILQSCRETIRRMLVECVVNGGVGGCSGVPAN